MGVTGLLPFVEEASKKCHLSEFRGCSIAVDSYCLLHRGAFGCAEQLMKNDQADGYVGFCMKYVKMLLDFDIKPVMVFDGQHLPAKAETEKKRREQRKLAKKQAANYLRAGDMNEYRKAIRRGIDITHLMALKFIQECRRINVDCIVAPYEADAEMAYLNRMKIVDAVVTEDSDLLLFGCDKIIFKLDLQATGVLVESEKLYLSMKLSPDRYSFDKFRYMCILSGCDYISSLPGIGLKKALKFIKMTEQIDIYKVLPKIPSYLNMRQINVTEEYRNQFMIADATFKHQIVYDPLKRKLVPLTQLDFGTDKNYCCNAGEIFDEQLAFQLALGNIDPFTHEKLDDWSPDKRKSFDEQTSHSIWSRCFIKYKSRKSTAKSSIEFKPPKPLTEEQKKQREEDLEKERDAYVLQLEKELSVYMQPCCSKQPTPVKKSAENEENQLKQSPVLNKGNPFISRKKLSKLAITDIDESVVVRSRFFHSKSEDYKTDSCTPLLTAVDEFAEQLKIVDDKNPHYADNNKSKMFESHKVPENYKKTDISDDDKELEGSFGQSKCNVENLTPSVIDKKFTSKPILPAANKTKLGSCRAVGLKKKTSSNSLTNQPTLLSMFDKMKKI